VKVVVTGGSGQLGTLVLRRLLGLRKVKQLVSLDLRPPALAGRKLSAIHADVRDPAIAAHFAGADAVIHLAFVVTGLMPRPQFDAINIGGTDNVLAAVAAHKVPRFIYTSSIAAYGVVSGHPDPIVETTPRRYQPEFAYSACKYTVEEHLDAFEAAHPDVALTRLRPAILVGNHMEHVLGDMLRRRVLVDSETPMPLVWDEDVADAIILALQAAPAARGAFNLGAREPASSAELARATGLRLLRSSPLSRAIAARVLPLMARLGVIHAADPAWLKQTAARMVMASDKARTELGWRPRGDTAVDVLRLYVSEVPGREDPRITAFLGMVKLAARRMPAPPEARHMNLTIHLALTGPGGGERTLRLVNGRLDITRGAPRPPDSTLTLRAQTLLDVLAGRTDFGTLQLTGALRVEGDPAAQMMLGAIVTGFKTQARARGLRGQLTRAFGRWLGAHAQPERTAT